MRILRRYRLIRIIPARAGFTSRRSGRMSRLRDHPRSRGVYVVPEIMIEALEGSSPLARGLRAMMRWPGCWRRDHPRSRGVYVSMPRLKAASGGSSPLARGLPRLCLRSIRHSRIIPARAGFTDLMVEKGGNRADHPRSRGVYLGSGLGRRMCPGSSPLARGLLRSRAIRYTSAGIIPARAGFTRTRRGVL